MYFSARQYENNVSVGLVALLLMPLDDLKCSKIIITDQDMSQGKNIMSRTGLYLSLNVPQFKN